MAVLTMRFRGQPVAAGGKEIGLVEPIHRLKGLETFASRCPLVFPQPFHPLPRRRRSAPKSATAFAADTCCLSKGVDGADSPYY